MSMGPKDPQRLENIDFDNIFDDKKDEIPQTMFESFRNTESSTVNNGEIETSNMLKNVFENQRSAISKPGSSGHLGTHAPHFRSTNRASIQPKMTPFDDFGFEAKKPQNQPVDFLDLKTQGEPQATDKNGDMDLDLMGLQVDDGIINQDIRDMEQNLFKKELQEPETFISNTNAHLEIPSERANLQSAHKVGQAPEIG